MSDENRQLGYDHGFELADTLPDPRAWASEVVTLAGTAEADLYNAAYEDWLAIGSTADRSEYAVAHVRGQIDRAKIVLKKR